MANGSESTGSENPEPIDKIIQQELGAPPTRPLTGLAFSGGGIRSASFCLGVARTLRCHPLVQLTGSQLFCRLDYLSTVSGGGYTGSAITFAQYLKVSQEQDGAEPEDKPSGFLHYIRQQADYLLPTETLNLPSLIAVAMRTICLSLLVYLPLLVMLFFSFIRLGLYGDIVTLPVTEGIVPALYYDQVLRVNGLGGIALILIGGMLLLSVAYSLMTWVNAKLNLGNALKPYSFRIRLQEVLGKVLVVTLLVAYAAIMKPLASYLDGLMQGGSELSASLALVGSIATALGHFRNQHKGLNQGDQGNGPWLAILGALLMITGLFLAAFSLAWKLQWHGYWVLSLALAAVVMGYFVNLNYVSLHRMYRDRLMEAFMPDDQNSTSWQPASQANKARLSEMPTCPYHLVNANIVLVDSDNPRFRGRGGDNFLLSPRRCGSDATGFCATADFMQDRMTLATAMAVSGAAINPHSGVAGRGPTRNALVSFLLTLLNIRLGYWTTAPNTRGWRVIPNYFVPAIKGLLGSGFSEKRRWIELTDGGHFENTAVYELIRRRCKLIIACDCGADPHYEFQDLGNLVERVRVDFNADIRFRSAGTNKDTEGDHSPARPSMLETLVPRKEAGLSYPIARQGYALADITYEDGSAGVLIWLKPTLTQGLAQDIYSYKMSYANFPQQPTSDQFFDEQQFEAYRKLGEQLCLQMLESGEINEVLAPLLATQPGTEGP